MKGSLPCILCEGIFAKPAVGEVLCPQEDSLPLTLICDNIRDPGNMGTIIRTAAAAGCGKIITTKGLLKATLVFCVVSRDQQFHL